MGCGCTSPITEKTTIPSKSDDQTEDEEQRMRHRNEARMIMATIDA